MPLSAPCTYLVARYLPQELHSTTPTPTFTCGQVDRLDKSGDQRLIQLSRAQSIAWTVKRVVVSQNEFWDSALAYFNVFFNFGVGSFSSTFELRRFLWGENGFKKFKFCNFKVLQNAFW